MFIFLVNKYKYTTNIDIVPTYMKYILIIHIYKKILLFMNPNTSFILLVPDV